MSDELFGPESARVMKQLADVIREKDARIAELEESEE